MTYKLGHFDTDVEAARVYDAACILLGLRDRMNFPRSVPGLAAGVAAVVRGTGHYLNR